MFVASSWNIGGFEFAGVNGLGLTWLIRNHVEKQDLDALECGSYFFDHADKWGSVLVNPMMVVDALLEKKLLHSVCILTESVFEHVDEYLVDRMRNVLMEYEENRRLAVAPSKAKRKDVKRARRLARVRAREGHGGEGSE